MTDFIFSTNRSVEIHPLKLTMLSGFIDTAIFNCSQELLRNTQQQILSTLYAILPVSSDHADFIKVVLRPLKKQFFFFLISKLC